MTARIALIVALVSVFLVFLLAQVALAQDEPCGQYQCVVRVEWNEGVPIPGIWSAIPGTGDIAGRVQVQSFNVLGGGEIASTLKVIAGARGSGAQGTLSLQPGSYQVVLRASTNPSAVIGYGDTLIVEVMGADRVRRPLGEFAIRREWQELVTSGFTLGIPGNTTLYFTSQGGYDFYLDYVWVVRAAVGAGTPTPTPLPATATPLATSTPYCVPRQPTPTPGLPPFATPTATPDPISDWFVFTDFNGDSLRDGWSATGPGMVHVTYGSAYIPNSVGSNRTSVVYQRPGNFPAPFYVQGQAEAQHVPAGRTQYADVYVQEAGGAWTLVGSVPVSSGRGYNFYFVVNTANVTAVAFSARTSDSSSEYGIELNYVSIYGHPRYTPICGGTGYSPVEPIKAPTLPPGSGSVPITYPQDKSCPPSTVKQPNNFWGYLIAALTIWMDQAFAMSPEYAAGHGANWARAIMGPVTVALAFVVVFVDVRIALWALLTRLAVMSFMSVRALWLFIMRTIKG